ncbi:hypothetical protein ABZ848_14225 [Streptomyces sp. NPDC047081]|uniref:hypothetical protein n=1 Tax=Streptomyces sp. NPDC047081 TaxID=3154706 RepID=UPI0033C7C789
MAPRPLKAAVTLAMAAAFSLAALPAHAAPDPDPSVWNDLSKTYDATAKYGYEAFAPKGGFARTDVCVADPKQGGMGYHYVNSANINSLDPAKPAALLYADAFKDEYADVDEFSEGRKLVAVEWIVKSTGQAAPTLFGQKFQGPDFYPEPLNGNYFTLHAWIYKPNESGLFAPWNPEVACPKA